jgi:hypothetical protein
MLKNPSKYKRDISKGRFHNFLRQFLLLRYWMTTGRIGGELWWTNQEFSLSI